MLINLHMLRKLSNENICEECYILLVPSCISIFFYNSTFFLLVLLEQEDETLT